MMASNNNQGDELEIIRQDAQREPYNPKPALLSFLENIMNGDNKDHDDSNMKMATAAMVLALAFMPLDANAAMSGGRMGGSFSSSRPSVSRSAPSSASYSRGFSRGYSSGVYSRPSATIITPGFGYNPFYSPVTPYYGSPGVIGYSRGPSFFDIAFFGAFLFVALNIVSKAGNTFTEGATSTFSDVFDSATSSSSVLGPGASVVQLSVALDVPNRDDRDSILGVLERLAQTAKTDSRVGIQNLTSQVALELLRRRTSISSASSSYKHYRDSQKASRDFQSKSVQERSKFEREVVSKFGGVDYSSSSRTPGTKADGKATMAVVTLILNIDGDSTKIPKINSLSDVEEALRKIASDAKVDDCLQSAEILWTPEDRTESLSQGDVVADYPELRSV
eukprot:CAMPEP_0113620404 /NCGR_PEP_ID=MMETSP0017_2-20120614/10396_1 /TAXON_ID=2856 /ORGANISM="Cylindrotheca closterium" /LENGTH=391 /DNA_ID=CAMNT_0000530065 /DNA_START=216 /DNA_END=1391 /DNA_ORIENTATION=+ /assembly_acc=CAM_ASM_000147